MNEIQNKSLIYKYKVVMMTFSISLDTIRERG